MSAPRCPGCGETEDLYLEQKVRSTYAGAVLGQDPETGELIIEWQGDGDRLLLGTDLRCGECGRGWRTSRPWRSGPARAARPGPKL